LISGSDLIQNVGFEKDHNKVQRSKSNDKLVVIVVPLVQECTRKLVIQVPQVA